MANKKENAVATETPVAAEEKMVEIRIPLTREATDDVFISVNDRSWQIQRGKVVKVPECVVEVLRNQEIALEKAYAFNANAMNSKK